MSRRLNRIESRDNPTRNSAQRRNDARKIRVIYNNLAEQIGHELTPSEHLLVTNASMLAFMCEREQRHILLSGTASDPESYRRNCSALRSALVAVGLAAKSRDITKKSLRTGASVLSQLIDPE